MCMISEWLSLHVYDIRMTVIMAYDTGVHNKHRNSNLVFTLGLYAAAIN